MPIQVRFRLTFNDYLKAQQLHGKRSWGPHLWFVLGRTLIPAAGIVYLLVFVLALWRTTPIGWLLVAIPCGVYFALYPLMIRIRLKRCYRRTRSGDGENSAEFGEESIRINAENTSSELNWKAIESYREDKNVFLLYLAPAKFIALPKRALTPQQIVELRSMLTRQVRTAS